MELFDSPDFMPSKRMWAKQDYHAALVHVDRMLEQLASYEPSEQSYLLKYKGELEYRVGRTQEAFAYLDASLAADPGSNIAALCYAGVLIDLAKDYDKASQMVNAVLEQCTSGQYVQTEGDLPGQWYIEECHRYLLAIESRCEVRLVVPVSPDGDDRSQWRVWTNAS